MKLLKLALVIACAAFALSCGPGRKAKAASILCGTTMTEALVKDIVPEAKTSVMVPPGSCPGSFDMKPSEARAVSEAAVFIIHPFQAYLAEKAVKINKKLAVGTIKAKDLHLPENYGQALSEAQEILMKYFPGRQSEFDNRRQLMVRRMEKEAMSDFSLRRQISKRDIYVLASSFHSAFASYCGFKVAAEFGGPDSLNPEKLAQILRSAKEKKASIIISNMTGNHGESAEIINRQLKIKKIEMTVFPLEREGDSGFFRVYRHNLKIALDAAGIK